MYHLNRNNQIINTVNPETEAGKAVATANALLADSAMGLTFDEKEHRYFLGDRELTSVTTIAEEYYPFDALEVATGCSKNPKHEHYGKDPLEIVAIWKENGRKAAEAGTIVHEFGEACYLMKTGNEKDLEPMYLERLSDEGLEASSPKEEAVARYWDDLDLNRYVIVAKETKVVNPIDNYAGTFDLLLYDLKNHYYVLQDYKTNKDLLRCFRGERLRAPFTAIPRNDHGKYTVQQNLYKIQLENIGLRVGEMQLVWLLESGDYRMIPVGDYGTLTRWAMKTRLNKN